MTPKNPNILATQLDKLDLVFDEGLINGLSTVAKVSGVEGVDVVSSEEVEAIEEAARAKASAMPDHVPEEVKTSSIPSSAGSSHVSKMQPPSQQVNDMNDQFNHLELNVSNLVQP